MSFIEESDELTKEEREELLWQQASQKTESESSESAKKNAAAAQAVMRVLLGMKLDRVEAPCFSTSSGDICRGEIQVFPCIVAERIETRQLFNRRDIFERLVLLHVAEGIGKGIDRFCEAYRVPFLAYPKMFDTSLFTDWDSCEDEEMESLTAAVFPQVLQEYLTSVEMPQLAIETASLQRQALNVFCQLIMSDLSVVYAIKKVRTNLDKRERLSGDAIKRICREVADFNESKQQLQQLLFPLGRDFEKLYE